MASDEMLSPVARPRPTRRRRAAASPNLAGPDLDGAQAGLQDEIRMLRLIIRRVMNLADEGRSLGEVLHVLDTVGRASTRLAGLLKAANELDKKAGLQEALSQALSEITKDFKLGG